MTSYVEGKEPLERQVRWREVGQLVGIAGITDSEWVAYRVDLVAGKIVVYNTHEKATEWGDLKEHFVHMSRFLPWICGKMGVLRKREEHLQRTESWNICLNNTTPQQLRGNDSGIMAIKIMDCIARGIEVTTVDPGRTISYRKEVCTDLWNIRMK